MYAATPSVVIWQNRMNPKTLQYIMGHSDISVTLNTYTHQNYEDAEEEMQKVVDEASKKSTTHRKRCVS